MSREDTIFNRMDELSFRAFSEDWHKKMKELESKDIRFVLQNAGNYEPIPFDQLNIIIKNKIGIHKFDLNLTKDYNFTIKYIEEKGYDWIMGNVNGHMGGTPYGCVGVTEDKASYSATPLLSLWLSYFRLELGDERKVIPGNS